MALQPQQQQTTLPHKTADDAFANNCCVHSRFFFPRVAIGCLFLLAGFAGAEALIQTVKYCLPNHPVTYLAVLWIIFVAAVLAVIGLTLAIDPKLLVNHHADSSNSSELSSVASTSAGGACRHCGHSSAGQQQTFGYGIQVAPSAYQRPFVSSRAAAAASFHHHV